MQCLSCCKHVLWERKGNEHVEFSLMTPVRDRGPWSSVSRLLSSIGGVLGFLPALAPWTASPRSVPPPPRPRSPVGEPQPSTRSPPGQAHSAPCEGNAQTAGCVLPVEGRCRARTRGGRADTWELFRDPAAEQASAATRVQSSCLL